MLWPAIMASCAAVYTIVGASYVRLATIRRLGREYGFFAALSLSLAVASLGAMFATMAEDTAAAERAMRFELLGITISIGALGNFVYPNVQRPTGRPGHVATAFAAVGLVVLLSGMIFDPGRTIPAGRSFGPASFPTPAMTPTGVVIAYLGLVVAIAIVVDVGRSELRTTTGRLVFATITVGLTAWGVVTTLRAMGYAVGPWFPLLLAPFILAVAANLLTRWVDVDDELARRGRELEHAYVELREAQDQLVRREQLAAVGELSAVIAHEVRNPLAVLKNAVSGLRRDTLSPDIRETLHGILDQETDRLNRLVRDLLSYARPIHISRVDLPVRTILERVIGHAIAGAGPAAEDVEVALDLDLPETVRADADLLERAFAHIVENAVQAMPNGGRLDVVGRRVPGYDDLPSLLSISIIDSGEGMDTLVRSRAKEPFFTTRQQGTGLGLAIVERVAAAHGGHLELARNGESGTRVTIFLPETEPPTRSSHPPALRPRG